ncbi:MAG: TonB-dependent receptor plug domain-containing protein [Bacteroidales bacterium]|nr:TonB-dependent receptor plug domain-containing protein [Bacteroidales bacterium]
MTEFLIYQGKTAVILAVFYMFYRLLLSKDTFHRFNRVILLGTAALSFVLPLCVITIHEVVMIPAVQSTPQMFENATIGSVEGVSEVSAPIWPYVLCSIFALGAFSVLVMTIISIAKVIGIITGGEHHILESGETLVITDAEIAPCSWMRYIVLSREDYESGYSQILTHEKAHIALRHSWDILFVDIITALQWFNPAMWMLKADLRAIHEFEADDAVLRSGADVKEYQYLLIRKAVSKSGYSVANSFNHSTLKARITMMLNQKSSRKSAWKALYVLPLVGISLAATAETKVDYQYEPQGPLKASVVEVHDTTDAKVIKISNESQAHIPIVGVYGAIPADDQYFEKQAEKVKIILDNAGANSNNNPIYIIDGQVQDADFDISCLNPNFIGKVVVWTPENAKKEFGEKGMNGVVEITSKKPETIDSTADGSVKVQYIGADGSVESSEVPQPLYVIDGQVMPDDYNLNSINTEDIESINVLKDGKQTEIYGERAKDGVVSITLKKKSEGGLIRFIPVSEPVGDLSEYTEFKLYSEEVFGKIISRKEYESMPNEALAYLYVKHLDNGKKSLHIYTLEYNSIIHLRKCKKTTDINDEKLAGVNENTTIIIDGKWDNYEGYQRMLKFQSDKVKEIEYSLNKDKKSISMISVIFDREYAEKEFIIRN